MSLAEQLHAICDDLIKLSAVAVVQEADEPVRAGEAHGQRGAQDRQGGSLLASAGVTLSSSFMTVPCDIQIIDPNFKAKGLALLKLKALNRKVHILLESKRQAVEGQKGKVDQLQLKLEKQTHQE